jgi:hypothetical protein
MEFSLAAYWNCLGILLELFLELLWNRVHTREAI